MVLPERSISRLGLSASGGGAEQAGRRRTESGTSHSCDRPTSRASHPRAQTISVALAMSDTTRGASAFGMPRSLSRSCRLPPQRGHVPLQEREPAEERRGGEAVAQETLHRSFPGGFSPICGAFCLITLHGSGTTPTYRRS